MILLMEIKKQLDASGDNCHCEYSEHFSPVYVWVYVYTTALGSNADLYSSCIGLSDRPALYGGTLQCLPILFPMSRCLGPQILHQNMMGLYLLSTYIPLGNELDAVYCSISSSADWINNLRNHWITAVVHLKVHSFSHEVLSSRETGLWACKSLLLILNSHLGRFSLYSTSFTNWSYKGCYLLFWPLRVVFGCGNDYKATITVSGPHWEGKNLLDWTPNHPICDRLEEQLDGPLCRLKLSAFN